MNSIDGYTTYAKPFLKWAGGKRQLIPAIKNALPKDFSHRESITYIEPFIGSGAVLFWLLQEYPNIHKAVINDINSDLTQAYSTIKNTPEALIDVLKNIEETYYNLSSEDARKDYFLQNRTEFNKRIANPVQNTALLIFLNKTCFNGLYRVNSKNHYNVPFGKNHNPNICDTETILADSRILQKVTILNGDYSKTLRHSAQDTFFYIDPPYKPISRTSRFNSYANETFDDKEQVRLKKFCVSLSKKGHQWLLSNSDSRNINPNDNFFDELYSGKNMFVNRVKAKRAINSKVGKRGQINELLISNYTNASVNTTPLPDIVI